MNKKNTSIITRDRKTVWHPCVKIQEYEVVPPLEVAGASGSHIMLANGDILIDSTASWWCKSLGHNHPKLQAALKAQLARFEHIIFANTTYDAVVELSEKLTRLAPNLSKAFYASDGCCAIEIAIKMSLQAQQLRGHPERTQVLALANSYHGETGIALAASDIGLYRAPYEALLPTFKFLTDIPYVQSTDDPLWRDCSGIWPSIESQLLPLADQLCAIIVEPILQGAGGLLIYSQDFLKRLRYFATAHNIHLIADEIATGFYRTGPVLACEHANIQADFVCLAKGLTSGVLPLSVMLTTDEIYQYFYPQTDPLRSFLHSNTHSGNALAIAVANACLDLFEEESIAQRVATLGPLFKTAMTEVALETGKLCNVRQIGAMVAADLMPHPTIAQTGFAVYQEAVKRGALLRPLGNTVYWMPPLIIKPEELRRLQTITIEAIKAVYSVK